MKYRSNFCLLSVILIAFSVLATAGADELERLRDAVASEDWAEAKSLGETLSSAEPENGEVANLLGKAYSGLGDREAAVEAYKQSVKFDKENADYYSDYGYALIMRGQELNMFQAGPTYMKALDQYKKAVDLDPDHLSAHIGLSRYYMNAPAIGGGSMKLAKDHAEEIARINPYLGHIEKALIAQKENRVEDAISEFESAVSMKSDDAWIHFELGKLYQLIGSIPESIAAYQRTLELQPEHEAAKAALGSLEG